MTGTQKYVLLPMQPDQGTPILSPVDVGERCASGMIMWMPQAKKPLVIMKRKGISMKKIIIPANRMALIVWRIYDSVFVGFVLSIRFLTSCFCAVSVPLYCLQTVPTY